MTSQCISDWQRHNLHPNDTILAVDGLLHGPVQVRLLLMRTTSQENLELERESHVESASPTFAEFCLARENL